MSIARDLRTNAGLSQIDLAYQARVHPTLISKLEKQTARPAVDGLLRIARVLGTTVDALLADWPEEAEAPVEQVPA